MKHYCNHCSRLLIVSFLLSFQLAAFTQDIAKPIIVSPFDSLIIADVRAIGNSTTGTVDVTMQVRNEYHKVAAISFKGGAFDDLGATDSKGVKYKIYSNDRQLGSESVNKGFSPITGLQLGKSKPYMFISVQDTLQNSQSSTLHFRLMKVDKSVQLINEIHLLSMLFLNYMLIDQREYKISNVRVEWMKPKMSGTVSSRP